MKNILSETTKPRVLIFGMKPHILDRYQVCSNFASEAKSGYALGSFILHRLIKRKHEKIFLS